MFFAPFETLVKNAARFSIAAPAGAHRPDWFCPKYTCWHGRRRFAPGLARLGLIRFAARG